MIRVLIVDDTPVLMEWMTHVVASDPELQVVGTAGDGEEAIEKAAQLKPDIILMDLHMPKMDGLSATRIIMETNPVPILIVSNTLPSSEMARSFRAVEVGALGIVKRPASRGNPDYEADKHELLRSIKVLSEVKVIRRWPVKKQKEPLSITEKILKEAPRTENPVDLVAIGASTGGPLVLQAILSQIPKDIRYSLAIVQHISQGFSEGFVEWLSHSCPFPIKLASHGEELKPGNAYVAPEGKQMTINRSGRIELSDAGPENGHRPSVSTLFRSVAQNYAERAVGVLLTGMGTDGAEGLKLMKEKGAITLVQDKDSSVVFGMPREAISLGAATSVLSPDKIAAALQSYAVNRRRKE